MIILFSAGALILGAGIDTISVSSSHSEETFDRNRHQANDGRRERRGAKDH